MQANQIEPGIYVRPVKNSQKFRPALYEVEERTVGGKVTLRDCAVPVEDCIGEYGTLETTVMQVVQSFVLVVPDPVGLDDLLAA